LRPAIFYGFAERRRTYNDPRAPSNKANPERERAGWIEETVQPGRPPPCPKLVTGSPVAGTGPSSITGAMLGRQHQARRYDEPGAEHRGWLIRKAFTRTNTLTFRPRIARKRHGAVIDDGLVQA
jgi:hypothetical protein